MANTPAAAATLPNLLHVRVNHRLHLHSAAVKAIKELAPESADGRETGGILIGRGPDDDGLIVVDQAGDAGPAAIRRPDFLLRDRVHAERLAQAAWTERHAVWVGEWHTHPMGGSQPSQRDLRTYAGLLAAAELEFHVFASVIVVPDELLGWDNPCLCPWLIEARARTAAPRQ